MQTKLETHEDRRSQNEKANGESLYRTKWLMAHNALHKIIHDPKASQQDVWNDYLKDLESSEEVAKRPA